MSVTKSKPIEQPKIIAKVLLNDELGPYREINAVRYQVDISGWVIVFGYLNGRGWPNFSPVSLKIPPTSVKLIVLDSTLSQQ